MPAAHIHFATGNLSGARDVVLVPELRYLMVVGADNTYFQLNASPVSVNPDPLVVGPATFTFGVVPDNAPPTAYAGLDQTVAAGTNGEAQVQLDGTGSSDPDADPLSYSWSGPFGEVAGATPTVTLSLGMHEVTLTISDGQESSQDTVTITVVDETAPEIHAVAVSPDTIWPPNHRMVDVTVTVDATDNCDANPTCRIVSISSDETPIDPRCLPRGLRRLLAHAPPDTEITGPLADRQREPRNHTGCRHARPHRRAAAGHAVPADEPCRPRVALCNCEDHR